MEQKNLLEVYDLIKDLPKDTVIGEFAGRDSVAAIFEAMKDDSVNNILPVASFSPTEYGDFNVLDANYKQMVKRSAELFGNHKKIFPLIYYSEFDLWSAVNGRFMSHMIERFGSYTPCLGCHAYLHLIRVPIALKLGKKIIAGERESHDGRVKLNQTAESIDAYEKICKDLGVELLLPIRHMEGGDEVKDLIGWEWEEGEKHQSCAFSGNYKSLDGSVNYNKEKLQEYIDQYLYPVCITLGKLLIEEENLTKEQMVEALERNLII